MKLEIVTPEETIYSGNIQSITLPGVRGSFTILEHHAPLITVLGKGRISYVATDATVANTAFDVKGGFVEVSDNKVNVCVEEITGS